MKKTLLGLFGGFFMVLGAMSACGGDGASIDSACNHVCDCAVSSGAITSDMKAACVTDCKSEAATENPTQACIDCVDGASCSDVLGGTACNAECDTGSDAGVAPVQAAPSWRDPVL